MEWLPKLLDTLIKPLSTWLIKKFKKPEPVSILQRRDTLKQMFLERMPKKNEYGVRTDVIIRDIKRMDEYPDINTKKKGISSWFKAELKGTYHRGIEVFIHGWETIKQDPNGVWDFCHYKDPDAIKVIPIARIPYDYIEHVDWDGDEYYNVPVVYCKFQGVNDGPYEEIPFFSKVGEGEYSFFREIDGFRPWDVRRRNWFRFQHK